MEQPSTQLPTQPLTTPHQTPIAHKSPSTTNKGLIIALIICIILALAGIAFGIFGLISSSHKSSEIDGLKSLVAQKDETIANLKQSGASTNNPDEDPAEEELRTIRDQQRRSDMAHLQSAIFQFQANNNGRLPGYDSNLDGQGTLVLQPSQSHDLPSAADNTAAKLITYYLNGAGASENSFVDPDGWAYGLAIIDYDHHQNSLADHMVYLIHQSSCADASLTPSDKPRDFAIVYKLENGNAYCLDNQ